VQQPKKLVAEGIEAYMPYQGKLSDVVANLVGGLRSGMGYLGAVNLAQLKERAHFVRVTTSGLKESYPHDVTVFNEL
ncbi:MAG: IMP dehydrogenase, partial [Methylococcaceae bacterium]|nr:IMP dehydrogenase [Methylococcaceae bacterium]